MNQLKFAVLAVSAAALSGTAACGADSPSDSAAVPQAGAPNAAGSPGSSGAAVTGIAGSTSGASGLSVGGMAGAPDQSGAGAGWSAGGSLGGGNSGDSGSGGTSGSGANAGSSDIGGAAGSGTTAYKPCPSTGDPCKILPFGDSITHGVKSTDDAGYRSQLFKLIVASKQKVTFTGSLTNGPTQVAGQTFPRMHEGRAGWTIDPGYSESGTYGGISSLVPSPALSDAPHIILLQIGTNDLFSTKETANMSARLEALIDKIAQNAPSALIVLAQITPVGSTNSGHTQAEVDAATAAQMTYNSRIPGIVQSHAAKGQHIIGVDMSRMPVPQDLVSGSVHPNDQGYAYMASIWYEAIKDLLPK